ncbi:hypothetical protein C8R45DRAFT_1223559 [Mycena sanguinolenta]|nr:hypothetical protein C8R45DRAFT_1223559 [Mycena sanguinolenta]
MEMDEVSVAQEQPNAAARVEDLWFAPDMIVVHAQRTRCFAFSPDDSETEKIEGFPVVRLHDPAADVEVFLRAIFDSRYFMPAPAPFPLSALSGILHKCYPKAYDERGDDHLTFDEDPLSVNFSIISAAAEVNAQWLLPDAYYGTATNALLSFMEGKTAPYAQKALALHVHLVRANAAIWS